MDVFKGIPFAAPPGRLQKPVPHPGWDGEYTCLFRCFQAQLGSKISECIDSALLLTLPAQVFWKPPTTVRFVCSSIFLLMMLWAVKTVSTWTSGSLRAKLVMQTCSNSQNKTKKYVKGIVHTKITILSSFNLWGLTPSPLQCLQICLLWCTSLAVASCLVIVRVQASWTTTCTTDRRSQTEEMSSWWHSTIVSDP